jgi:hypothetical protein
MLVCYFHLKTPAISAFNETKTCNMQSSARSAPTLPPVKPAAAAM